MDRGGYQPDLADLIEFESQPQKDRFIDSLQHKGAMPKDAAMPVYLLDIIPHREGVYKIWALLPYSETYTPETFLCRRTEGEWKILPDPEKFKDQIHFLGISTTSTEFVIKQNRQQLAEWENAEGLALLRLIDQLKINHQMYVRGYRFAQEHHLKNAFTEEQSNLYRRTLDKINKLSPEHVRQSIVYQLQAFLGQSSAGEVLSSKNKTETDKIPVMVSARLLLLPDDLEKIESIFENAGVGFPKVFTSVVKGPADSQQIRAQFETRLRDLDSASLSTFLTNEQVKALIKAAQKEPEAVLLSAPAVRVYSGEEAEMSVGNDIPADTKTVFHGVRMLVVPAVHEPTGNIHLQMQTLVSGTDDPDQQNKTPNMEVAEISSELTIAGGHTALIFGPVIKKGIFSGDQNTPDNPKRLLLLITPEVVEKDSDSQTPGIPMENLPGGFGAFRRDELEEKN